jgi:hypothetical protein
MGSGISTAERTAAITRNAAAAVEAAAAAAAVNEGSCHILTYNDTATTPKNGVHFITTPHKFTFKLNQADIDTEKSYNLCNEDDTDILKTMEKLFIQKEASSLYNKYKTILKDGKIISKISKEIENNGENNGEDIEIIAVMKGLDDDLNNISDYKILLGNYTSSPYSKYVDMLLSLEKLNANMGENFDSDITKIEDGITEFIENEETKLDSSVRTTLQNSFNFI